MKLPMRSLALAAAVTLVGAGAAWAQPATAAAGDDRRHDTHHRMGPAGAGFGEGAAMAGRALDAVGASAEQKTRVREIFRAAHDDLLAQRADGSALRQQMMALMTAPQLDAASAEVLRQQQMARHDLASRRMMQAMFDAAAVLTPEQRRQLAERIKARSELRQRHQRERRTLEAPRS